MLILFPNFDPISIVKIRQQNLKVCFLIDPISYLYSLSTSKYCFKCVKINEIFLYQDCAKSRPIPFWFLVSDRPVTTSKCYIPCRTSASRVKMFPFWAEILTRMLLAGNHPLASKSACLLFFKTFLIRKMSQKISEVVGWRETGSFEWQSREGWCGDQKRIWWWWGCARVFDELVMLAMSLVWARDPFWIFYLGEQLSEDWKCFVWLRFVDHRSANSMGRVRCSFLMFFMISWRFLVAIMHATLNNFLKSLFLLCGPAGRQRLKIKLSFVDEYYLLF